MSARLLLGDCRALVADMAAARIDHHATVTVDADVDIPEREQIDLW